MRSAGAKCGAGDNGAIKVSAPTFVAATLTRREISSVSLARDVICVNTHVPQILVVLCRFRTPVIGIHVDANGESCQQEHGEPCHLVITASRLRKEEM